MEPQANLRLLFISLCLVVSLSSVISRLPPDLSPAPQPVSSPSPSPSPSPAEAPDFSQETVEFYPISPSESESELEIEAEPIETNSSSQIGIDFTADLHAVSVDPELKKICEQTDHTSLCLATVLPLIKDSKTNVNSVLQKAVEASSAFAQVALSEAKKIASKPGTPEDLVSTLEECQSGYETAIENFQKTLDAFSSNDLGTMRSMLSAVITYVGDCQDQFTEMQIDSPLTGYSEKLTEMASNCLAISSLEN